MISDIGVKCNYCSKLFNSVKVKAIREHIVLCYFGLTNDPSNPYLHSTTQGDPFIHCTIYGNRGALHLFSYRSWFCVVAADLRGYEVGKLGGDDFNFLMFLQKMDKWIQWAQVQN